MARYNNRETQEAFEKDVGLPGSVLPQGQGYILRPSGMVDVPQAEGVKKTFYPTTTGGQLDLFGIETPARDEKGNQEEEISQRMEAYKAMSIAELHKDLANAGFVADEKGKMTDGDPILMELAYQEHILRTSKINAWNQNLQDNFNTIKKEEKLNQNEKQVLRNKVLAESDDPIHIPTIQRPPQDTTIQRGLGKIISHIAKNEFISRQDFLYGNDYGDGVYQLFGPNALETIPGLKEMADKYFPEKGKPVSVKQVQPAGRIRVQDINGNIGTIPENQRGEAIKAGFKVIK